MFISPQTWVGNKRRKLASKVEQNGGASHSLPSHGLAGGVLSNHTLAGGSLSNHGANRLLLPAELNTAQNIQNRVHLLPPSSSFPSFSSSSSSPSSSSPLSSGSGSNNNNNNDIILTGIYSLSSVPRPRPKPAAPLSSQPDSEHSAHPSSSLINQALQSRSSTSSNSSPLHSKLASLSQNLPSLTSASGPSVYTAVRKGSQPVGEAGVSAGAGAVPHSWTRQYGTAQTRPWSSSSQSQAQPQPQPRPHSNPQPQPPASQKTRVSLTVQNTSPASEQTPRIQQVFTLSEIGKESRLAPGLTSAPRVQRERPRPVPNPLDTCHNFSIAMETADEENEWQREEELANMAAQTHIHREQTSPSEPSVASGSHTPPMTSSKSTLLHGNTALQGSYSLTAQTSLTGESSSQVGGVLVLPPPSLKVNRKT